MKRILACLATLALSATSMGAKAQAQQLQGQQGQTAAQQGQASKAADLGLSPPAAPKPGPGLAAITANANAAAEAVKRFYDPIGDAIVAAERSMVENAQAWLLKATLYHSGRNMSGRDSLGCKVSPMRTVAVDPAIVARHSIIFIKETVGLRLDGGGLHDGYWYASDIGGGVKGQRIDLFTGRGAGSMRAMRGLNLHTLTVTKVGDFAGCPPMDGGTGLKLALAG
jgi:3D (Asp-Asp-Asp) domain-containing protein